MPNKTTITDNIQASRFEAGIDLENTGFDWGMLTIRYDEIPYLLEYLHSRESGIDKDILKRAQF